MRNHLRRLVVLSSILTATTLARDAHAQPVEDPGFGDPTTLTPPVGAAIPVAQMPNGQPLQGSYGPTPPHTPGTPVRPSTWPGGAPTPIPGAAPPSAVRTAMAAPPVVMEKKSPAVADSPDNYRGASGFDFVRDVPAAWDETRGLSAVLDEHVAVARRSGDSWYVGAMTNESARRLDLPLSFLSPGRYQAEIWQDGGSATEVVRTVRVVRPGDRLDLKLAPSGGAVARIRPLR